MNNPKQLNYTQQLEHRLAMINDDTELLNKFIDDNGLRKFFDGKNYCISNIFIACDPNDDESLSWRPYSKQTLKK